MPTNRTRRKRSRADLDEHKLEQMIYGPDSCLLAGLGYTCPSTRNFFSKASEEGRTAILDDMRADWLLHHETILAAAAEREPWAMTEFGEPK